jgi:hypothetical protein
MRKTRLSMLILIELALLFVSGLSRSAEAGIRVTATLHTPDVHVRIGGAPRGYTIGHLPVRRPGRHMVGRRDRAIALRLARYTGVPARRLIRLRTYGYTWFEIGRWLRLPPQVVRAAMDRRSWSRFRRSGARIVRYELLW